MDEFDDLEMEASPSLLKTESLIDLQEMLTNISEKNCGLVYQSIIENSTFSFPDENDEFINEIFSTVLIRPKIMPEMIKLMKKFGEKTKLSISFLKYAFQPEFDFRNYPIVTNRAHFLRFAFLLGYVSIKQIEDELIQFSEDYYSMVEQLFIFFMFFAPEIESHSTDVFNKLFSKFILLKSNCRYSQAFTIYADMDSLRDNSWKLLKECYEYGNYADSLSTVIKTDNVEKFISMIGSSYNTILSRNPFEVLPAAHSDLYIVQYAALFSSEKCFNEILEKKPKIFREDNEKTEKDYTRIEALFNKDDIVQKERSLTLYYAIAGGNQSMVARLIRKYISTKEFLNAVTIFRRSSLLHSEYQIGDEITSALFDSIKWNNLEMLIFCLTNGADITSRMENNMTPLHYAASYGHIYPYIILNSHASIVKDTADNYGYTPLHVAALNGRTSIIKYILLQENPQPNVIDNFGRTPLSLAAMNGHSKAVECLLSHEGVDPNIRDKNDMTPFLLSAQNGRSNSLKVFLESSNIDFNARANFGMSALHFAAESGSCQSVILLLQSNLFPRTITDFIQRTPAEIAKDELIIDLLQ